MHIADDMPAFWLVHLTMLYSESFSASGKSFWDDALEYLFIEYIANLLLP